MGAFQAGLIHLRMEGYPKVDELSGTDVLVLATLFSFAADDDRPQAFPSAAKIAARSRLGQRTVQRSLDHLEKVGVITGEHRHRRPTRWSLDPHFIKGVGVTKTPEVGGSQAGQGGAVNATEASAYVRATQGLRQSGGQQASEGRTADVTATHQGTEVGSGAKRRNRTDVKKGGSGSGKPARSARRAPSAPPPNGSPSGGTTGGAPQRPNTERPRCPHGVPGGLWFADAAQADLRCKQCNAIAPHPKTEEYQRWIAGMPGLDGYLTDNLVACSDPTNEQAAEKVARRMLHHVTKTQSYFGIPDRLEPEFRRFKAYAVDRAEPGSVQKLMAAHGHAVPSLGLGHLPSRCPECEAHIQTQGHLPGCNRTEARQ